MSTIIESIERRQLRKMPRFEPGDRVRVHFQVVEGNRRRTQVFEGVVIARQGSGARETFTVRKQSFGVGVERTFPVHSPKIERLEIVARGDVRRAKLYYLRGRIGKRARVAERRWGIESDLVAAEPGPEAVEAEGEGVAADEAAAGQEGEAAAQPEGEPEAEAAAQPEGEAEPKPEGEAEPEPEADAQPEAEAEAQPEAEAETQPEAEAETQPEATPEAETPPEAEAGDGDDGEAAGGDEVGIGGEPDAGSSEEPAAEAEDSEATR